MVKCINILLFDNLSCSIDSTWGRTPLMKSIFKETNSQGLDRLLHTINRHAFSTAKSAKREKLSEQQASISNFENVIPSECGTSPLRPKSLFARIFKSSKDEFAKNPMPMSRCSSTLKPASALAVSGTTPIVKQTKPSKSYATNSISTPRTKRIDVNTALQQKNQTNQLNTDTPLTRAVDADPKRVQNAVKKMQGLPNENHKQQGLSVKRKKIDGTLEILADSIVDSMFHHDAANVHAFQNPVEAMQNRVCIYRVLLLN